MNTRPPPTSAERLAARQTSSASITKQLIVLAMGMAGAATIAGILGQVTEQTNPIWTLPVIMSGFVCFMGFLATTGWTMHSAFGSAPRPIVTGGLYLTALLLVGGVVAYASEVPRAAYLTPLTIAVIVAALTTIAALRRRARITKIATLRRGTHAQGTVTDDGLAAFATTPNLKIATITVSFRDASNVERWVTTMATQAPSRPIAVGDRVDVWFDATAPGDINRIVVEHDNGASRIAPGNPSKPK
ncbi:hypothetical protein [Dyella tabacisoli]|uniref:Uncharacterized protein n=1 Tax=Dyella tabacisoli TaxID=2282381 RepID=A0A369UIG8_9GAMM|nr:hypothetical protein [Dyella tabacisoli]RDD80143.1 hypothetical protein DVJ77_18540 [Dyella tabacisoli]